MKKTTEELMEILKQKKSIHAYFTEEIDELEFASLAEYLELLLTKKDCAKAMSSSAAIWTKTMPIRFSTATRPTRPVTR